MDETIGELVRKLRQLEIDRANLDADIQSIEKALELIGVKPPDDIETEEREYVRKRPFRKMSLVDACLRVLKDSEYEWLTKSQVEYLVSRGGFESSAKDRKNSVDVTLRRLFSEGKCAMESRGRLGNRYRHKKLSLPTALGQLAK
jgi:hypothetical protein